MQIFFGNGGQSQLKLLDRSEKNFLCNFNHSYLAIRIVKLHKIFTTYFHTSLVQDPTVGILKNILNRFVINALESAVLSGFLRKNAKEL